MSTFDVSESLSLPITHSGSGTDLTQERHLLLQQAMQLGARCHRDGKLAEAEECYRVVLDEQPDHAEANHNMGVLALNLGHIAQSIPYFQCALKALPAPVHYWLDYVDALLQSDQLLDAWRALKQGLDDGVGIEKCLSLLLRLSVAMQNNSLLSPKHASKTVWREEAKKYAKLRKARPSHAEQLDTMDFVIKLRMVNAEAMAVDLLIRYPLSSFGWMVLGTVWTDCRINPVLAEQSLRHAVHLEPTAPNNVFNLGGALLSQGRMGEAEACYLECLRLNPNRALVHSNYLFCLAYNSEISPSEVFKEHLRFAERFETPFRAEWPLHKNDKTPERRLKVGFVSPDLRDHAVVYFIEPILAKLTHNPLLEMHVYYTFPVEDGVSERLKTYVHQWNAVASLSNEALAERILADEIDILVDLSNHTARNRMVTFARKPAPVQVTWIGAPSTTGLSAMDYYFSDQYLTPADHPIEAQFTEKIVRLPAACVFQPMANSPEVNELPALKSGSLTFGSFNRLGKVNQKTVRLWAQLLRELPGASLVIGDVGWEDGSGDRLRKWFEVEGIDQSRLQLVPRCDLATYMHLHHLVDICLDSLPYGGGTTTFHALWMGVPTLTVVGETVPGRSGMCILAHMGLSAFVATDDKTFVENGRYWASHLEELSKVRMNLRESFNKSLVGKSDSLAMGLELAFRMMWRRWCEGLTAESMDVTHV